MASRASIVPNTENRVARLSIFGLGFVTMPDEEMEIRINGKAFDRLSKARKEGETFSDVIIRLSAATLEGLQRRGELEVVTSDGKKLILAVEQDKCLGAIAVFRWHRRSSRTTSPRKVFGANRANLSG